MKVKFYIEGEIADEIGTISEIEDAIIQDGAPMWTGEIKKPYTVFQVNDAYPNQIKASGITCPSLYKPELLHKDVLNAATLSIELETQKRKTRELMQIIGQRATAHNAKIDAERATKTPDAVPVGDTTTCIILNAADRAELIKKLDQWTEPTGNRGKLSAYIRHLIRADLNA